MSKFDDMLKRHDETSGEYQEPEGFMESMGEMFTGERRKEAAGITEDTPRIEQYAGPGAFKAAATTLFTFNPEEEARQLQEAIPGSEIRTDDSGVTWINIDGLDYVVNEPGMTSEDVRKGVATILSYLPAARFAGKGQAIKDKMIRGGVGSAGTQTVIEGIQAGTGGDFDPEDVILAGIFGTAVEALPIAAPPLKAAWKNTSSKLGEILKPKVKPVKPSQTADEAFDLAAQLAKEKEALKQASKEATDVEKLVELGQKATRSEERMIPTLKGKAEAIEETVKLADVDPEVVKLYAEAGLLDEMLPGYVTRNPEFRAWNAAVASSEVKQGQQHKAMLEKLAQEGDELIKRLGGDLDLSATNQSVLDTMDDGIKSLKSQEKVLYKQIDDAIPGQTPIKIPAVTEYINKILRDSGGDMGSLNSIEKRMLRLVKSKKPTYFSLDRLRKEVGSKMKGGLSDSTFGDVDSGDIKNLYALLSRDQGNVIASYGDDALAQAWTQAKRNHTDMLKLKDAGIKLFGKEMDGSFVSNLNTGMFNLSKGDVRAFNKIVNKIPKEYRQEAVAKSLQRAFNSTPQKGLSPTQFVTWYEGLMRNKEAKKLLFKNLPDGSAARLERMYKLSKPVDDFIKEMVTTGRLVEVNRAFRQADSVYNNVHQGLIKGAYETGKGVLKRATSADAVNVVDNAVTAPKTKASVASDNLLSDPSFQGLLKAMILEEIEAQAKQAEKVMKSNAFKAYWNAATDETKRIIADNGLVEWLRIGSAQAVRPEVETIEGLSNGN